MSSLSSLYNVHKKGLFGDFKNKNKSDLIKIKEIKNINLYQVVKYKNSKENISNFNIDGIKMTENLKTGYNSSTRVIWMGPDNWYVFSTKDMSESLKIFKDVDFAITNLSHSRSIIDIEGSMVY